MKSIFTSLWTLIGFLVTILIGIVSFVFNGFSRRIERVENKCDICNPLVIETHTNVETIMRSLGLK